MFLASAASDYVNGIVLPVDGDGSDDDRLTRSSPDWATWA